MYSRVTQITQIHPFQWHFYHLDKGTPPHTHTHEAHVMRQDQEHREALGVWSISCEGYLEEKRDERWVGSELRGQISVAMAHGSGALTRQLSVVLMWWGVPGDSQSDGSRAYRLLFLSLSFLICKMEHVLSCCLATLG